MRILISLILFIIFVFTYRLYKRIGRRCDCGAVFEIRRYHYIHLAPDESISIWTSGKAGRKRWRWWIRRVFSVTFSVCSRCNSMVIWKTSKCPISVWHAWWVKLFKPSQYKQHPRLGNFENTIYLEALKMKNLSHLNIEDKEAHKDCPPIVP
jgi:hypothetical protein